MDKADKKEIRTILVGKIVRVEENVWKAAPEGMRIPFQGMSDGSGDVRLFGIARRQRSYQLGEAHSEVLSAVKEAMKGMGKTLMLKSAPQAAACLYRSLLTAPVLLIMEEVEGVSVLSAYTGRAVMAGFSCAAAMNVLEQKTDGKLIRADGGPNNGKKDEKPEEKPEEKRNASGKSGKLLRGRCGRK